MTRPAPLEANSSKKNDPFMGPEPGKSEQKYPDGEIAALKGEIENRKACEKCPLPTTCGEQLIRHFQPRDIPIGIDTKLRTRQIAVHLDRSVFGKDIVAVRLMESLLYR